MKIFKMVFWPSDLVTCHRWSVCGATRVRKLLAVFTEQQGTDSELPVTRLQTETQQQQQQQQQQPRPTLSRTAWRVVMLLVISLQQQQQQQYNTVQYVFQGSRTGATSVTFLLT
jgi:hypothetical protein